MKRIVFWFALLVPALLSGQDYLRQFPYHQKTRYFDFYSKRNPQRTANVARFADAFITLVGRDFMKTEFNYPIRVLVLEDQAAFGEFLRRTFHDEDPPGFGIYLGQYKLFATYETSGLGTFAHEILHPLVDRNLPNRPVWTTEGIPSFFEKFYGYWERDELVVQWGYQNPWRIEGLGTNLTRLNLESILSTTKQLGDYHESDLRMVSVFLWEQGRFPRFLQLVQGGDRKGYGSFFEAAMEMPLQKIQPLWQRYLESVEAQRKQIALYPKSEIFPDKQLFERYHEDL